MAFDFSRSKSIDRPRRTSKHPKTPKEQEEVKLEKEELRLKNRPFVRYIWSEAGFYIVVVYSRRLDRVVYRSKTHSPNYELDYTNRCYGEGKIQHKHTRYVG